MYDISLQHQTLSFAAGNKIHVYGNNLSGYRHLSVRTRDFRPRGRCQ